VDEGESNVHGRHIWPGGEDALMQKEMAMTESDAAEVPVVEVYWRPGCPFCRMLLRSLRRSGLVLREVNIWEDPEAAARVRSVADGNETVPTVFIGDQALVNPSMRQVLHAAGTQPRPRSLGRLGLRRARSGRSAHPR